MSTQFKKLTDGWNAEPNSPLPKVAVWERDILLTFYLNAFVYEQFEEGDIGLIRFRDCRRYRLGRTNDEGWYRGQCRFSGIAPGWGEFYQVSGDLKLDRVPEKWIEADSSVPEADHFLFYFRDETFECSASSWALTIIKK